MPAARSRRLAALGVLVVLTGTACSSGDSGEATTPASPPARGGTLSVLNQVPVRTWDPQRMYDPATMSFAGRVFERTLTTFGSGHSAAEQSKLVPDLATDTGRMSDGGRTWKFTLRSDATWQDGKPVTCKDVRYGVSRSFSEQVSGGPDYAALYLDIPRRDDGSSAYLGPYDRTGQSLFDQAVTCSGQVITFHMSRPFTDFNQAVTLPAFGPYRQDKDKGSASRYAVFSNGPYMLSGEWSPDRGGTFVRNPAWKPASDSIRKGFPDRITYTEGMPSESSIPRIMSDSGDARFAVSQEPVPPALQAQIRSSKGVAARSTNPLAPDVDYLLPNFRSSAMSHSKARQALAMSTNRDAYITAYGGPAAGEPTFGVINRYLPAFKDFNPFGTPTAGDPQAARKVLESSGLTLPVPITVAYWKRPTADKAFAALKVTWEMAGFKVTLKGIPGDYYSAVQGSAGDADVFWSGWRPDWPSGSTVIPPVFDGRLSSGLSDSGQDLGHFNDPAVNDRIDRAQRLVDPRQREQAWGDLDEALARTGAHVALDNQKLMFVHGSGVRNYSDNVTLGGYVDLAGIAVR